MDLYEFIHRVNNALNAFSTAERGVWIEALFVDSQLRLGVADRVIGMIVLDEAKVLTVKYDGTARYSDVKAVEDILA